MAFTGNYICSTFKKELMTATHNFTTSTGNVFKIALYTNSATLDASTTVYSATNEIVNTSGTAYVAGGKALTNVTPTNSGTVGLTDFADISWTSAVFTARGALIYNTSSANAAVCVLDFGSDKEVGAAGAGTFTIVFPTADSSSAIIRIA
jgi:hypothetical protein